MPETVFVQKAIVAGVVRGVDVDAFDFFAVLFLQQIEYLPVLGMKHQTIGLLVQSIDAADNFIDQSSLIRRREKACIHHQRWVRGKVCGRCDRLLEFGLPVIKQALVGSKTVVESRGDFPGGNEPVGIDHLFFQREQVALKGFQRVEKFDDAGGDGIEAAREDQCGRFNLSGEQRV